MENEVILYHGTAADHLESIREDGFCGMMGPQLWNCSAGLNYFWCPEDLNEDSEAAEFEALDLAKNNAEISLIRAKDCRRLIFKLAVPRDYFNEWFQKDNSCQNMDGAVLSTQPIPFHFVTNIWRDMEDLSFSRPYFAAAIINNELSALEFTITEQRIIKSIIESGDFFTEELRDLEMEKIL